MRFFRNTFIVCLTVCTSLSVGCVSAYKESVGGEGTQILNSIYKTDFNTAWQAVLDGLKNSALDVSNREGGFIQTRWTDNTTDKNFTDSYVNADSILKAQYRFRVNVSKGATYNGLPSIKVAVQKEQLIQRDVLEGWTTVSTDSVEEKTLLYRIGRLIWMRMKLAKIEEEKAARELKNTKF